MRKFPENLGDFSEEQGERFDQDIHTIEERYQGGRIYTMNDYCWNLCRDLKYAPHSRKSYKKHFFTPTREAVKVKKKKKVCKKSNLKLELLEKNQCVFHNQHTLFNLKQIKKHPRNLFSVGQCYQSLFIVLSTKVYQFN